MQEGGGAASFSNQLQNIVSQILLLFCYSDPWDSLSRPTVRVVKEKTWASFSLGPAAGVHAYGVTGDWMVTSTSNVKKKY
jgi:hypothetical protein